MAGIFRSQQCEGLAVEAHHIEMCLVGVFVFFAAVCQKINAVSLFVHIDNLAYDPRAYRQLAAKLAGLETRKIEMVPAVALGGPKHVARFMQNPEMRFSRIDVAVGFLANHGALFARGRIHFAQLDGFFAALPGVVRECLAIPVPVESRPALKLYFDGRGLHFDALATWYPKDNRFRL